MTLVFNVSFVINIFNFFYFSILINKLKNTFTHFGSI